MAADKTKDTKTFWTSINKMRGHNKQKTPYIKDQNGTKLHEENEQESAFKREWVKVFKISDEENEDFDSEHEYIESPQGNI